MSLFKRIFSKEKKETLDKGLEKTKTSFFSKLSKAVAGKTKVDDDVLDSLEEILVSSDVGVNTTLKIIDRIEARVAKDKYLGTEELNMILREEIAGLLAETNVGDAISPQVGAAIHCVSDVAMIILLVYPAGMNKLLVELSLYLDSTFIANGGNI